MVVMDNFDSITYEGFSVRVPAFDSKRCEVVFVEKSCWVWEITCLPY